MNRVRIMHLTYGAVAGGIVSVLVLIFLGNTAKWKWTVVGVLAGAALGLFWPVYKSIVIRLRVEDWRLEEVEISGVKFTSGGTQRRVAWRLFVEMTTRIATQPMQDHNGQESAALASLHHLFGLTRQVLAEMEPTPTASGETIETFALNMLNSDLRPFLTKWHPLWEEFDRNGDKSKTWPQQAEFRVELKALQARIESRARGLAQIAGVKNVDRFFPDKVS
jgi:hypothetical protein